MRRVVACHIYLYKNNEEKLGKTKIFGCLLEIKKIQLETAHVYLILETENAVKSPEPPRSRYILPCAGQMMTLGLYAYK
jgi:hypothetical protein